MSPIHFNPIVQFPQKTSQKKNYFSLVHWKLRYGLAQLASLVTLQREMQCIEYGPIVGALG